MMSYKIMLHTETKMESFANSNAIATYNVFSLILGNERVYD